MINKKILIVDDDKKISNLIDFRLKKHGYATYCAFNGREALEMVKTLHPVLVLLDIRLPDTTGMDVLTEIKKISPEISVIMISAHADVKAAVDCMKLGAYDFIEKPIAFPDLDAKIKHIFDQLFLVDEVSKLRKELGEKYKFKTMVGKSSEMKKVFDAIEITMKSDVNVMIEGESGTGKELVARAIHFNGTQKQGPFVAVNCGAIPENLLESELFGHEKGSFTGAVARRIGKFEQANGGTLFLDEIGDLPAPLQVKLLRVLQEREIERVGGTGPIPIHARFIVATHRDLKKLVAEEKFREDLYFRVNVFPIRIPALRERKDDIPELLQYFMKKDGDGKTSLKIDPSALAFLMDHDWPGNIRELENFVERLLLIKKDTGPVSLEEVRQLLGEKQKKPHASASSAEQPAQPLWQDKEETMAETEKKIFENALREAGGNVTKASKLVQVSRDTFYRKMKKYALLPQQDPSVS